MRPNSHRDQHPAHGCFDCRYGVRVEVRGDLLCLYGDDFRHTPRWRDGWQLVELRGVDLSLLSVDEYDRVLAGRVVDHGDICDEWTPGPDA